MKDVIIKIRRVGSGGSSIMALGDFVGFGAIK